MIPNRDQIITEIIECLHNDLMESLDETVLEISDLNRMKSLTVLFVASDIRVENKW